jgi:hypothetical protein
MGRKVSIGVVGSGGGGIGTIIASGTGNTLSTALANQDLIIDPNGTGGVLVEANLTITDQQDLRLREAAANGTNYIAMQAAETMAANYTITWPAAVSTTAGFFLSSDGSGIYHGPVLVEILLLLTQVQLLLCIIRYLQPMLVHCLARWLLTLDLTSHLCLVQEY